MSELTEKLTNNTLQGQVEYQDFSPLNDVAIDETWKYVSYLLYSLYLQPLQLIQFLVPYLHSFNKIIKELRAF